MNKDFKDAASMQFISKSHNEQEVEKTTKTTGNRKVRFIEIQKKIRETKSKSLNLLDICGIKIRSPSQRYEYK